MSQPILVQIIGAPIACKEGVKDSWRDVSKWAADHLKTRFGEAMEVHYFDLFDADCPPMPDEAQLPLVLINGEVLSNGGKISVPAIRRKIESIKEKQAA
jgi:disulfide oxidoreductase YuzD